MTLCLTGDHDKIDALYHFLQQNFKNLNELAAIVRHEIPKIHRAILGALITIDVHARDIVAELYEEKIQSANGKHIVWKKHLKKM